MAQSISPPDGYTLPIISTGHVLNPSVYRSKAADRKVTVRLIANVEID